MGGRSWVVVDFETGGLDPRTTSIVSVGLCRIVEVGGEFHVREVDGWKVQPDRPVHPEAAKVNGYTEEGWKFGLPQKESLKRLKGWRRKGEDVIAHNADFDRSFMFATEDRMRLKTYWPRKWLCTMQVSLWLDALGIGEWPNHKLDTLAKAAGHWADGRPETHEAGDDAVACAQGFMWAMRQLR